MKEFKKRSIVKAISWRLVGTMDTFLLSLIITKKVSYAATISIAEVVTKICIYYVHERIWNKIIWGKD